MQFWTWTIYSVQHEQNIGSYISQKAIGKPGVELRSSSSQLEKNRGHDRVRCIIRNSHLQTLALYPSAFTSHIDSLLFQYSSFRAHEVWNSLVSPGFSLWPDGIFLMLTVTLLLHRVKVLVDWCKRALSYEAWRKFIHVQNTSLVKIITVSAECSRPWSEKRTLLWSAWLVQHA